MPQSLGDQLDERGWQAGAVVSPTMLPQIAIHLTRPGQPAAIVQADDWLVVVSQTCDVVQSKLDNEPLIEVLHCQPVANLRGEYQGRKSTRRLDFRPNKPLHATVILSAHAIADRYVVPRDLFGGHGPDDARQLSTNAIVNLQQWYALRYSRPAWPDRFNERIDKKAKKRLVDAIKMLSVDEVEVRVCIAEGHEELPANSPYHLAVFYVVDQAIWDGDLEARTQAYKSFSEFVSVLNGCEGIEVSQDLSDVKSGDAFTWQLTRTTDEWNFANLSEHD